MKCQVLLMLCLFPVDQGEAPNYFSRTMSPRCSAKFSDMMTADRVSETLSKFPIKCFNS